MTTPKPPVWAERFEGDADDLFAAQDEIAGRTESKRQAHRVEPRGDDLLTPIVTETERFRHGSAPAIPRMELRNGSGF